MRRIVMYTVVVVLSCFYSPLASATTFDSSPQGSRSTVSAFRKLIQINNLGIKVPTVVDVPIQVTHLERDDAAVVDASAGELQPYFFKQEVLTNQIPLTATTQATVNNSQGSLAILDNDTKTFDAFELPKDGDGTAWIRLLSNQPVTASSFTFLLDENVAMPTSVEVRAIVNGRDMIVLAKKTPESETIFFPRTTSQNWTITFRFAQPLRISELRLYQENAVQTKERSVRFLAQPGHTYRLYFDADRSVPENLPESGNLAMDSDVLKIKPSPAEANISYAIADSDGDTVPDIRDNCVSVVNSDQLDVNGNGVGDVCEDFDKDGIPNFRDNCPNMPNVSQSDVDADGIGDACDTQESRITEANPWIPWAGIIFAAVVILGLFAVTLRTKPIDANSN